MPVSNTHAGYNKMLPQWQKMDDVCSSQQEIYDKGTKYLAKLSRMDDDEYEAYKNRASFIMFTERTLSAFSGMVMRKDVSVTGFNLDNIDGKGGDINTYVKQVLETYLRKGRCGTLVDLPLDDTVITVADEIEKNITPRLLFYNPENILNWKTKVVNNVTVLSMVVLRETIDDATDEFESNPVYQYRVLDLYQGVYRQRLFNKDDQQISGDIFPLMDDEFMEYIPFVIHGGVDVIYPPLLGVADQNIKHYQKDAHLQHGLHFVALPTPWLASDLDPKSDPLPSTLGPTNIWYIPEEATCGMLEFTGAGLARIEAAMDRIVEMIIILASRILAPEKSSNDESALAASIRANAETSTLAGITRMLSRDMEKLYQMAAVWDNKDPNVKIKINSDFMPLTMSGTDALSFITAWIKGGISFESMFELLKRGEVHDGNRSLTDELAAITEEQRKRMADEVEKAEKLGKVENKNNPDDKGVPSTDPERKTKLDRRIK